MFLMRTSIEYIAASGQKNKSQENKTVTTSRCGSLLITLVLSICPNAVLAEHGASLPATIEERVCLLVVELDNMISEYGFAEGETPTFDDDRLNRALVRARNETVSARMEVAFGSLTRGFRDLRAAVRELEKGASVPVSGFGFAEDLAILTSGRAEFFTEDLLLLAALLGVVSVDVINEAELAYLSGVATRDTGEWETSTALFGKAIRILDRELVIGALTCS